MFGALATRSKAKRRPSSAPAAATRAKAALARSGPPNLCWTNSAHCIPLAGRPGWSWNGRQRRYSTRGSDVRVDLDAHSDLSSPRPRRTAAGEGFVAGHRRLAQGCVVRHLREHEVGDVRSCDSQAGPLARPADAMGPLPRPVGQPRRAHEALVPVAGAEQLQVPAIPTVPAARFPQAIHDCSPTFTTPFTKVYQHVHFRGVDSYLGLPHTEAGYAVVPSRTRSRHEGVSA